MLRYFFFALLILAALPCSRWPASAAPRVRIRRSRFSRTWIISRSISRSTRARFFADGRAARKPVEGTVPIGYTLPGAYLQAGARNATLQPSGFTNQPDYYNTGRMGDVYRRRIPGRSAASAFIKRGQERFNINCAICHGKDRRGQWSRQPVRSGDRRQSASTTVSKHHAGRTDLSHDHQRQEHHGRVRPDRSPSRIAGRSSPMSARCSAARAGKLADLSPEASNRTLQATK